MESVIVREDNEPGSITVAVPRFKLRLTVSILLEFYSEIIHFESVTPQHVTILMIY